MHHSRSVHRPARFAGAATLASLLFAACPSAAQPPTKAPAFQENPLGLSIDHATVGVADMEKERQFFHEVLGFRIGLFRNRPRYDHQRMHLGGFRVDMIAQKGSTRATPTMTTDQQGWLHIDFAVADADATYHHLKATGANVTSGLMNGDKVASMTVVDPEGNRIEISQPSVISLTEPAPTSARPVSPK